MLLVPVWEHSKTPEIGIRRPENSPKQAQILQKELLEVAVDALSPGGFLIYAVCSLEPEEESR